MSASDHHRRGLRRVQKANRRAIKRRAAEPDDQRRCGCTSERPCPYHALLHDEAKP